jgi:UDP-glucose 4-epimerase
MISGEPVGIFNEPSFFNLISSKIVNQKILVTGGASFIGSHLVERLVHLGARVVVIDDLSSGDRSFLKNVEKEINFLQSDVRNIENFKTELNSLSGVFHLAAVHGGRGFIEKYPFNCAQNVALDAVVFNYAATNGAEWVTTASSACAYPTNLQQAGDVNLLAETLIDWDNPKNICPDGDYGWSKLYSEILLNSAARQYGITGAACRIFTAYGPRENESHAAVALLLKGLLRFDPYPIWGTGEQTRNFTYVDDTVTGLLATLCFKEGMNALNCGTQDFVKVNDFVQSIFAQIGWSPNSIQNQLDKPTGVSSRASNNEKILKMTGWEPGLGIDGGIKKLLEYWSHILDTDKNYSREILETLLEAR